MNKDLRVGPVQVRLYRPNRYSWHPAVWWGPGNTYIRPVPGLVFTIPRRWWPCRDDGYHKCHFCNETHWMEGSPNCACPDCHRTIQCIQTLVGGPPWWPDRLAEMYKKVTGEDWKG